MPQYTINIGTLPNDGTGDPLRTAFNEVNLNFNQIFAAGPVLSNVQIANNSILTTNTNGNLILAPNGVGVVQSNVHIVPNTSNTRNLGSENRRWSTVYVQYANISGGLTVANLTATGDVTVGGNLSVTGNIINVANIVTDAKTIQLANTAGTANAANGSGITVGANDAIATFLFNSANTAWTTNIGLQVGGPITGTSLAVSDAIVYGNVDAINGNYTGNIVVDTIQVRTIKLNSNAGPNVNTLSNITVVDDTVFEGNVDVDGTLFVMGNVSADYFIGDGSQLTGLPPGYANANVVAYGQAGWAGNIIPSGNAVYSLGNATNRWANLWLSGNTIQLGDLSLSASANGLTSTSGFDLENSTAANIEATGNITANNFIATEWVYGNLGVTTQQVQFNDPFGFNANTAGLGFGDDYIVYEGQVPSGIRPSNPDMYNLGNVGYAWNEVHANVFYGNGSQLTGLSFTSISNDGSIVDIVVPNGDVTITADSTQTWAFDTTGNLILPNNGSIIVDGGDGVIGPVSDDMVISWDNEEIRMVSVAGSIEMQADAAFRVQTNYDGGTDTYLSRWEFNQDEIVNITGPSAIVTEAGNLNLQGGRDTLSSGNVTVTAINNGVAVNTWTFDNSGNLIAPGNITTTGNVTGDVGFFNDVIVNNASTNALLYTNSNREIYDTAFAYDSGNDIISGSGAISTTGNISAGYLFGNASQLTGLPSSYSNANVATFLAAYGSNTISTTGNITAGNLIGNISITGNVTGTSANVTLIAGSYAWTFDNTGNLVLPANTFAVNYANGTAVTLGGTYGNANVANFLGNLGSNAVSTTGNITASNFFGNVANLTNSGNTFSLAANGVLSLSDTTQTYLFLDAFGIRANTQMQLSAENFATGNNSTILFDKNGGGITLRLETNAPSQANWAFYAGNITFPDGSNQTTAYGNANATNLLSSFGNNNISTTGNVTANNFIGNISLIGNIQGTSANVELVAGSYTWTFDNTGTAIFPGTIINTPVPLANLTAVAGARAFVNDANLVATGNFGSQISGGGANLVPVWSDGSNWYIG